MIRKFTLLLMCMATFAATKAQTVNVSVTNQTNVTCNNGTNGAATLNFSGCTGPFTYTINNGTPVVNNGNSANLTNLAAGTYNVSVTTPGSGSGPIFEDNFTSTTNWTLNSEIGTQGNQSNIWIINNASPYSGSCDNTAGGNSLHMTCNGGFLCQLFGPTANYNESGAANQTDKFAFTTNNISTVGRTGLQLKFTWQCVGTPGSDYGNVRYSINGGTTWVDLPAEYSGSSSWSCATVNLPVACENIATLKLGFRWRNDGVSSGAADPSFNIDNVSLTGQGGGGNGCTGTTQFTITQPAPFVPVTNVTGNQSFCDGGSLTISATNANNCTPITVTTSGSYTITCQDQNGCSGTSAPVNVTELPPFVPITNVTGNVDLCNGDVLILSATNANNCTPVTITSGGTYSITCTDGNNCTGTSAPVTVTMIDEPTANFTYTQINNYTVNFTSTSTGADSYTWVYGDNTFGNSATASNNFPAEGNYNVTLIVTNACGADTVTVNVIVTKTGLEESSVFSQFSLFPNPANGQVMLQLNAIKPVNGTVRVISPMGQIIAEEGVKFNGTLNKTFDISNLAAGMYNIVITTDGKSFSRKLIVE